MEDAILGTPGLGTCYVHCTKNRFVALYYAEERVKREQQSANKIVCIDLSKVHEHKVHDISNGQRMGREAAEKARS